MAARTTFTNKESAQLINEGFKKEFRATLVNVLTKGYKGNADIDNAIDPTQYELDLPQVAIIMNHMGFLQSKLTEEQENKLDDLFTMFKINRDQKINAENLQNILLIVSGQREPSIELQSEERSTKWMLVGQYDQNGQFLIREGEHSVIQNHFKLLRLNRLQQKKALTNISNKKKMFEEPTFEPKVSEKSKMLAQRRRDKILTDYRFDNVDIVTILLHPNQQ